MKTKQPFNMPFFTKLFEKLSENYIAKIICLALAVVFYVFFTFSSLDKKSFVVPLNVEESGKMSFGQNYPKYVTVTVKSKPEYLNEIDSDDVKATLDISHYTEKGKYSIPVVLDLKPSALMIDPLEIVVRPEKIDLQLEETIIKYVNIEPSLAGTPEHGYEQSGVSVEPPVVRVSGPESMVNSITKIFTNEVLLNGNDKSFTTKVELQNINHLIKIEDDIKPEVTVSLQASLIDKQYSDCPVFFNSLEKNLFVKENPLVSFTVSGAELTLERYLPNEYTIQADCSQIKTPGTYEIPITIVIPESLKIISQSQLTLTITVEEKPIIEEVQ